MALPGWLIKGCTCELRWVLQKTPLNSNGSKLLSLLGDALSYKALGQIAWTSSLCVEALSKKIFRLRPSKKREGKEPGWERIDDFWFLGSSHWDLCICSYSCILDSQNHFNESPFSLKQVTVGLLAILIQTGFSILPDLCIPPRHKQRHPFVSAPLWVKHFILCWE